MLNPLADGAGHTLTTCPRTVAQPGRHRDHGHLRSHKGRVARDAIDAARADLRFPLPYSPDFDPIEFAFSKLKTLLHAAATRTREALWETVGRLLGAFTPHECANLFNGSGSEPE